MKRFSIILLIVLLIAGLFIACDNETIVDDAFTPTIDITSETKTLIPGNKYKTVADTTIADRITIDGEGSVTIILKEGTTLTAEKGINVTDDQELQIEGTGSLVATGDPKTAGIGGGEGEDGGTVLIQGGDIRANGGEGGGAGIGGGKGGNGGSTIIQKLDGKSAPNVTTKGGNATSHGIGNGDGATGAPEDIELDGVGLESSDDELTWYNYDEEPHYRKQYMRTFDGAIITFNANGGTGDMAAQVVHVNKDENLKENTFTRTGMSFKGWNTKADGSGTAYANMASININADITLYAQWETAPVGNYITSETTSIKAGLTWTIKENVVNNNRITIDGTEETTIFLPAGKQLTLTKGINVITPQTLIIDGDSTGILISGGSLTTPEGAAGIGGYGESERLYVCGTIIIKNGDITAYGGNGGNGGAGIGGGYRGNGGTINIHGGKVKAYAGTNAAGIGGGLQGSGGTITISDAATVVANGGTHGEGIGKGYNGASSGTLNLPVGTLVSDDNTTWVIYDGDNSKQYMRTATILSSSTTEWTDGNFYTLNENVTISAERVIVTGSVNLILPAGKTLTIPKGITVADTNSLTIDGTGTLTINNVDTNNSGIGGDGENPNAGTIIIKGGDVNTTGGENGAGIGGGLEGSGGTITITDAATFVANGGTHGEGIGKGYNGASSGTLTLPAGTLVSDDEITWSNYDDINSKRYMRTATILSSSTTAWSDGNFYTLSENVTIPGERVIVTGSVNLILPAGKTLTIPKGITVANTNSLTIDGTGTGTLTINNVDTNNSGIGGDGENPDAGTIIIKGGVVKTTGGENGAGIGGGNGGSGGTINISGGKITSEGGNSAACIGGGNNSSSIGQITITGGDVKAWFSTNDGGAGIGGSNQGLTGTISISGGKVVAAGGSYSAGIGSGEGDGVTPNSIVITISGDANVTATGGSYGAGIGGGKRADGGTISIQGGTIVAGGGHNGAGIGGGEYADGGEITISGVSTNITATGVEYGAGIGGGYSGAGGTVIINGGTVTATGDYDSVGIGGGYNSSSHGKLTIGYAEIQVNSLVINSGWSLYYGDSEDPTDHVDGLHDADDISVYVRRYMNVTQP